MSSTPTLPPVSGASSWEDTSAGEEVNPNSKATTAISMASTGGQLRRGPTSITGRSTQKRRTIAAGRELFNEDDYRSALNRHYGKLLKMSQKFVGKPNERELVMLRKIRKLESELELERQLTAPEWDPIRARIDNSVASRDRDKDIQVNIYGLETSMQSVAVMDSAFAAVMKSAVADVEDVERTFETKVSIGAPNFKRNRLKRQRQKELSKAMKRNANRESVQMNGTSTSPLSPTLAASSGMLRGSKSSALLPLRQGTRLHQVQRITGGSHVPHLHTQQKPVTKNGTWGFPIYFAPGDYGPEAQQKRERAARAEALQQKSESLRMQEVEEEQKAVMRIIESEEREADYETFVILADRFGALDGELFTNKGLNAQLKMIGF